MAGTRFNCDTQDAPTWHDRAAIAASFLVEGAAGRSPGAKAVVADIGCGDGKLRKLLDPGRFDYEGYDLIPQAGDVARLDLNTETLPHRVDFSVLLGVLEYIAQPARVLERLAANTGAIVVSHRASDLRRVSWWQKRKRGWRTILAVDAFERLLTNSGYVVERRAVTADGKTAVWRAAAVAGSSAYGRPNAG